MLDLCYPCVVDYDVFISFKNLPDDAFRVMDMFGIPHDYYRNVENHPEYLSSDLVELYFGDMSKEERRRRFTAFNEQAAVSIKDSPLSRYIRSGCMYCSTLMCDVCAMYGITYAL